MPRPDIQLLALRPAIKKATTDKSGVVETFQNAVIRPVIKLQHDVIIAMVEKEKTFELAVSGAKTKDEYRSLANIWLQKRPKIKNQLIGVVMGMFLEEEIEDYHLHYQEYDKRILQIILTRVADTLY